MQAMTVLFLLLTSLLEAEHTISAPMPAEDGETCVVCYGRCTRDDVAYLVDGQRFAVMKPLEKDFLDNPDQYIAAYQPNSMQFGGPAAVQQPMPSNYLWFGIVIVAGLLSAGLLSTRLKRAPATQPPAACPACGQSNHPSASLCLHCGTTLTPSASSEAGNLRG